LQRREDRVDEAVSDSVKKRLLSAFPEGAFAHVDVLEYGDDPAVEPGTTAVRVFIDRAGRPEESWDSRESLDDFAKANSEGIEKLHDGLLPSIAWVEFVPDTPARRAMPYQTGLGSTKFLGKRSDVMDDAPESTPVMTRLGPADLATVDALIAAGIATSRAEVIRWALGRIRENPAYTQIQERVREISELKAQF
jgi:hypothetical protein